MSTFFNIHSVDRSIVIAQHQLPHHEATEINPLSSVGLHETQFDTFADFTAQFASAFLGQSKTEQAWRLMCENLSGLIPVYANKSLAGFEKYIVVATKPGSDRYFRYRFWDGGKCLECHADERGTSLVAAIRWVGDAFHPFITSR